MKIYFFSLKKNNNERKHLIFSPNMSFSFKYCIMINYRLNKKHLTVFPLTHSVARELEAIAEPQPKVLNFASTILPFLSTLI